MVSQLSRLRPPTPRHLHVIDGQIQVFTCTCRSFFTDVMAQALRAAGQGTPVLVVQFLKGGIGQGPEHPVQLGQHLDWLRCGLTRRVDALQLADAQAEVQSDAQIDGADADALRHLWQHTQTIVGQGRYSLVVLDELSLAIKFNLVSADEVLAFLNQRPPHVDVVLTGPEMPSAILQVADQVTELRRSHRF
ncbi:MAG: cob(I)yrinic acid a,c-diamide adenosyltransferase [Elainellaceae cyanobacterium]